MNLKVCLNFWVCFVLCVALILQPRTVYREWEQEADFKIWNHSPTEISGEGPLDYIHLIHPRGHYLSRLPLASQTLIDNLNGKILCALGSFFHRIPITSVGKPLHLALEFHHPKPVESFPASSFVLYSHQMKSSSGKPFLPFFLKTLCESGCLTKSSEADVWVTWSRPFYKFRPSLDSHWCVANTGWFLADWKSKVKRCYGQWLWLKNRFSWRTLEVASPTSAIGVVFGVHLPVHSSIRGQVMKHVSALFRAPSLHQRFSLGLFLLSCSSLIQL